MKTKARIEMLAPDIIEDLQSPNSDHIKRFFAEELTRARFETGLKTLAEVCRKQQPKIEAKSLTGEDREWLQNLLAEIEATERAIKSVLAADKGMASEAESLKLRHELQKRRTEERLRDLRRGSH